MLNVPVGLSASHPILKTSELTLLFTEAPLWHGNALLFTLSSFKWKGECQNLQLNLSDCQFAGYKVDPRQLRYPVLSLLCRSHRTARAPSLRFTLPKLGLCLGWMLHTVTRDIRTAQSNISYIILWHGHKESIYVLFLRDKGRAAKSKAYT